MPLTCKPTEYKTSADLPDAALVAGCIKTQADVLTNGDLVQELIETRAERDKCAAQIDALADWRKAAVIRNQAANK